MTVRRHTHGVIVGLAALLLVGGCADDPEPKFSEPTDSPTPSETDSSPVAPQQTAEEFIREWVRLDNQMQATGETDAFRAASSGCQSCVSYAERVADIYRSGGFIRTEGRTVLTVKEITSDRTYRLKVRSAPTKYREGSDSPTKSLDGGVTTYRLTLRRSESGWVVADEAEVAGS